jgi:hypothetical protein
MASRRVERGSFTPTLDCPTRSFKDHSPSCQARAVYTQHPEMMWRPRYAFSPNSVSDIRYTSDSNGQGVHKGQPVANEPFAGVEQVTTNISTNILLLEECQPPDLGAWTCSGRCIKCSVD